MLTGKNVLLGVSGGIAAYKMADVASKLVKLGADVHVIMTKNAEKIITKDINFSTSGFQSGKEQGLYRYICGKLL